MTHDSFLFVRVVLDAESCGPDLRAVARLTRVLAGLREVRRSEVTVRAQLTVHTHRVVLTSNNSQVYLSVKCKELEVSILNPAIPIF